MLFFYDYKWQKWLLALPCLSVCMEKLGSHWMDFHYIWYFIIFQKSIQKIQDSLKSDKNSGYFTIRLVYICEHLLLSSS